MNKIALILSTMVLVLYGNVFGEVRTSSFVCQQKSGEKSSVTEYFVTIPIVGSQSLAGGSLDLEAFGIPEVLEIAAYYENLEVGNLIDQLSVDGESACTLDISRGLQSAQDSGSESAVIIIVPSGSFEDNKGMAMPLEIAVNTRVCYLNISAERNPRPSQHDQDDPRALLETMAPFVSVFPNPFNPTVEIRLTNGRNKSAKVTVFDIRGRTIKEIYSGILTDSPSRVSWDGTDSKGHSVPSGVYFYVARIGASTQTGKMMLLK
ncbi:MAG: T9SS type A sorting domain-containing protein [Candidatus Krumholzibacteriia bacterium]